MQFINTRKLKQLLGIERAKDIYILVHAEILRPIQKESFQYLFSMGDIRKYIGEKYKNDGLPQKKYYEKIIDLRKKGFSMVSISEQTGIALSWVKWILEDKKMGRYYRSGNGKYKSNRYEVVKINQENIFKMRKQGDSYAKIGKKYSVSYQTIRNIILAHRGKSPHAGDRVVGDHPCVKKEIIY